MNFPARVTLLSGAIVLVANTSQMEALPIGGLFEPDVVDFDGAYLYRERQPDMATEAKTYRAALVDAALALDVAARVIRDGGLSALKARQTHEAWQRATAVLEDQVHA